MAGMYGSQRSAGTRYTYYGGGDGYMYPTSTYSKSGASRSFRSTTQAARDYGASRAYRPGSLAEAQAQAGPIPFPGGAWKRMAMDTAAAYLSQFLQDQMADPWAWLRQMTGWGKVSGGGSPSYDFAGAGWTRQYSCTPDLNPGRKMGISPNPPGGVGSISATIGCNLSYTFAANCPVGTTIPAGSAFAQFVCYSSPINDLPNQAGDAYERWNAPGGSSPAAIPYAAPTKTMPLYDPFPEVSPMVVEYGQEAPGGGARRPYEIAVPLDMEFRGDGSHRAGPGVHKLVPPSPGEKEDKGQFPGVGRDIQKAYGFLTEVGDALQCMEKNMKKGSPKAGSKAIQDRIAAAVHNVMAGNMDVPGFMLCFALNEQTDKMVGLASGAATRNFNRSPYNPRRRSGLGWGTGGFSTRMR